MEVASRQNTSSYSRLRVENNLLRIAQQLTLPLILILFAAPFVAFLRYTFPATDDFCAASLSFNTVPQSSATTLAWMYYSKWSPTWLTVLLQAGVMSRVNLPVAYGWLLLAIIVLNLFGLWFACRRSIGLSRSKALLVSGIFYAAWVASISHPTQQLFWLTGSIGYNLVLTTILVLIGLLCRPSKSKIYYIGIALLAFAIPAQHQVGGVAIITVLVIGVVSRWMQKLTINYWLVALLLAGISQVTLILSPGNAIRAAQEHKHLWDFRHAHHWIAHAFYHGLNWLVSPAILIAGVCILLLISSEKECLTHIVNTRLSITAIATMFALILEAGLIEIATGTWLPPRVEIQLQFLFWIALVLAILSVLPELYKLRYNNTVKFAGYFLLAVSLFESTNFRWAVEDLQGPARSWHNTAMSRLNYGGANLEFEAPGQYPNLSMPQLLTPDPNCWVNKCFANYLHAESVVVTNSTEECPH